MLLNRSNLVNCRFSHILRVGERVTLSLAFCSFPLIIEASHLCSEGMYLIGTVPWGYAVTGSRSSLCIGCHIPGLAN